MQILSIDLPLASAATARGYLHDLSDAMPHRRVRPCVVICPGGGYSGVSDREKDPPALALLAAGYQVFTLTYSVGNAAADFQPLMELSCLLSLIRKNAEAWQVDTDKIAVMGFSAGGHLAASLGTLWNHPRLAERMDVQGNQPNALILCYPVITAGPNSHQGSIERVSGGDAALAGFFSLETQAGPHTPPTFVWHTQEDAGVPVENALLFLGALRRHAVPFEAHIFQRGPHGLSMCTAEVGVQNSLCAPWFPLLLQWLGDRFDFEV